MLCVILGGDCRRTSRGDTCSPLILHIHQMLHITSPVTSRAAVRIFCPLSVCLTSQAPPCWFSGNRTHVVMWCIMGNVVIPPVHLTDLRVTCVVERPFKSFCRFLLILCASVSLIPPVFNVPTAGSPNHWVAPLLLYGLYEALHAGGLRLCADRNFLLEMEG